MANCPSSFRWRLPFANKSRLMLLLDRKGLKVLIDNTPGPSHALQCKLLVNSASGCRICWGPGKKTVQCSCQIRTDRGNHCAWSCDHTRCALLLSSTAIYVNSWKYLQSAHSPGHGPIHRAPIRVLQCFASRDRCRSGIGLEGAGKGGRRG